MNERRKTQNYKRFPGPCKRQECIPVGCVPSAAVAVRGGVSTPPPGTEQTPPGCRPPRSRPPWVWGGRLPRPDPPQLPPWVWAWRPPQPWPDPPKLPPWVWAWKPARYAGIPPPGYLLQGMLGYHQTPRRPAARHAGIPPPCGQNS